MNKKLFILAVVFILAALVLTQGCAKKFNIVGTWAHTESWFAARGVDGADNLGFRSVAARKAFFTLTFVGSETSGTWSNLSGDSGVYTVTDNTVVYSISSGGCATYTGTASDDHNTVTGTASCPPWSGTFSLTRM